MYYFSGILAFVVAVGAAYGMTEVFSKEDYTRVEQQIAQARGSKVR